VSAVLVVDAGPRRVVPYKISSTVTEVTETFDYSTHKAPRLLEFFG